MLNACTNIHPRGTIVLFKAKDININADTIKIILFWESSLPLHFELFIALLIVLLFILLNFIELF